MEIGIKMNAQELIDSCDNQEFNTRQFRDEINISWMINDVVKQFKEAGNE